MKSKTDAGWTAQSQCAVELMMPSSKQFDAPRDCAVWLPSVSMTTADLNASLQEAADNFHDMLATVHDTAHQKKKTLIRRRHGY